MHRRYVGKILHRTAWAVIITMQFCTFECIRSETSYLKSNELMSDMVAMPLSRMLGTAGLVVLGNVEAVRDSSFEFRIRRTLIGTIRSETIGVLKVKPDRFASVQPPPYRKGQTFLLFLNPPGDGTTSRAWKVMGVGGEGQMPVEKDYVYFRGNNIKGLEFNNYTVQGAMEYVQRFELPSFLDAIEEYGNCFKWNRIERSRSWTPERTCDDSHLDVYSRKGFIHNYLAAQTKLMIP